MRFLVAEVVRLQASVRKCLNSREFCDSRATPEWRLRFENSLESGITFDLPDSGPKSLIRTLV